MESYPDDYSFNQSFPMSSEMDNNAIFTCVTSVIMTIVYIFIISAIFIDRQRYQKTFLMALLNFAGSYTLLCMIRYFGEVHILVFNETNKSICHSVHFLYSVIAEGSEMAMFPIYIDMIVQNMMSERYEKRKYKVFMMILISVTWLVMIIKEIIYRTQSIIEIYCLESKPSGVMWTEFVFIILRIAATLVAVGFLLFIAKTKLSVSQILGSVLAPILIGIIVCIVNILTAIYQSTAMVGYSQVDVAVANLWLRLFAPIILALIWLLHKDFRESIMKLATCSPCRKMRPEATEHELSPNIA